MDFKNWLESKGIRLNPQIRKDLSRSIKDMDGFYDGSGDEKSTINTINPYTNQPMEIPLNFRHDPNGTYDARFHLKDKHIDINKRNIDYLHSNQFRTALNHEFIHAIDPKSNIRSNKEDKKPYMKMLSEFDAFSGEVVEDIHMYVDRKIRYCKKYYEEEDLKNNLSKLKWQLDYALRYLSNPVKYAKIRGIFDEIKADNVLDIYLHDAMKDRIGSIGTNMRKRLITRLYHACNDALNLVEKEIQKLPNYEVDDEELL